MTIGEKLDQTKGFGGGFDFLRIFLSLMVVFVHSYLVVLGDSNVPVIWFANYWVLAVFFGLSGFLITGSAQRLDLKNFLINRGMRIFPALAVEIVLAVLLLGPIFTTLALSAYFSDFQTLRYLTNIVGIVNYDLPGVFREHPSVRVNTSLWTVPFELACYVVISGLILLKLLKRPAVVVALALGVVVAGLILTYIVLPADKTSYGLIEKIISYLLVDRGSKLFAAFLFGIAAYLFRYDIPYSRLLFAVCLVYSSLFSLIPYGDWATTPLLNLLTIVPLLYVMVFVGVTDIPRIPFFRGGDYSYGIYLYGFPLQQAVYAIIRPSEPMVLFALSIPPILAVAYLSWHYIEKPLVILRRKFSFTAKERLSAESMAEPASPRPAEL